MKKILVFAATLVLFLSLAHSTFARTSGECSLLYINDPVALKQCLATATSASSGDKIVKCPEPPFDRLCNLSTASFGTTIGLVINFILVVATVVALFYLIYGGLKWIMSEGDKSAVETARTHITASIIRLIVIFLAFFIINVLLVFFIGKPIHELVLPELKIP